MEKGIVVRDTEPTASKRKKRVLAEDDYVSSIEAIIERDFFPDIPRLRQSLAQMNAGSQIRSNVAGELFTTVNPFSSSDTPAIDQCTQLLTPIPQESAVKLEEIQEASSSAPKQRLDVFLSSFTSEDNASFSEIQEEHNQRKRLKVQHLLEPPKKIDTYIDWPFTAKNRLFYYSASGGDVAFSKSELAHRVKGPARELKHENTRFPAAEESQAVGMKPGVDYSIPGEKADQRPLLHTPTPVPGKNVTPIMTWGELAGTPIRLDKTPGFVIKDAPDRDVIGRRMASNARKSILRRSARYTPASVRATPKTMSAAGQKLASNLQKSAGTDLQLRASYSGTPCRKTKQNKGFATPIPAGRLKTEVKSTEAGVKITDDLLD